MPSELSYDPLTGVFTRDSGSGPKLCTPQFNSNGYKRVWFDGKQQLAHRVAFTLMGVEIPSDMEVDHIDGDKGNNSWINLRLVTGSQNKLNIGSAYSNNQSTSTLGVSYHPEQEGRKHYRARLCVAGKSVLDKWFLTLAEAGGAYMAARKVHADPLVTNTRL